MFISRHISKNPSDYSLPEDKWIPEMEFYSFFDSNLQYESIIYPLDKNPTFIRKEGIYKLTYAVGRIKIFFEHGAKISNNTLLELYELAQYFNAYLLQSFSREVSTKKIDEIKLSQKKSELKPKPSKQTDLSFGQNNVWLVLKGSFQNTLEYFSLKPGPSMDWETGIMKMERNEGILAFYHEGYTYLAGQQVENLFQFKPGNDEELERQYFQKLSDWSKTFEDVQFYLHYNKLFYANAFYRFLNQELVYGEFYTEGFENNRGKIPPTISSLYDTDANNVSEVWGIGPESFKYVEGVKMMGVFVCR
ncbi:MAG: hypothetical protein R2879_09785 [Saprospiraceae bacterium]